jgi:hypothetical protein
MVEVLNFAKTKAGSQVIDSAARFCFLNCPLMLRVVQKNK